MQNQKYISFNGEIIKEDEFKLQFDNRAFLYGDGFFESMHAYATKIQFFNLHHARILKSLKVLKMQWQSDSDFGSILQKEITRLLNKNKFYTAARIRITFFRKSGGLYPPINNGVNYLIQCKPLTNKYYQLNTKGLHINVFPDIKKSSGMLSSLKLLASGIYVMAGIFKTEQNLDDCLILNEHNNIAEALSSNIFIVKNEQIFTPPLAESCVSGIMRKKIIKLASNNNMSVEEKPIPTSDLLLADEIFLTNAIKGIQWVVAYKNKRYYNNSSKKLIKMLNENAFLKR